MTWHQHTTEAYGEVFMKVEVFMQVTQEMFCKLESWIMEIEKDKEGKTI